MTETNETSTTEATATDIVIAGKAALRKIQSSGKRLIDEWVTVGKALNAGLEDRKTTKASEWLTEHFPDLAGQKYASTRKAAMWLARQPDELLQELKKDGNLNHPVAIQQAYKKAQEAAAPATGKVASKGEAPAVPPQQDTSPAASQDAEASSTASVEAEAQRAVAEAAAVTEAPPARGFLARYVPGGRINRDFVLAALGFIDQGPERMADKLCEMSREDLDLMCRAFTIALERLDAGAMQKAA